MDNKYDLITGSSTKKIAILSALLRLAALAAPANASEGNRNGRSVAWFYLYPPKKDMSECEMVSISVAHDGISLRRKWYDEEESDESERRKLKGETVVFKTLQQALQNEDFLFFLEEEWYSFPAFGDMAYMNVAVSCLDHIATVERELSSIRATLETTLFNQVKDADAASSGSCLE